MRIESTRGALVAVLAAVAVGLMTGCIATASESDIDRDPSLVEGSTSHAAGRVNVESNGQTPKTATATASNPSNPNPNPNPTEPQPFPWVPGSFESNAAPATAPTAAPQPAGDPPVVEELKGAPLVQAANSAGQ